MDTRLLAERHSRYFAVMTALLLVLVLVGFSRSFYLRPLGDLPPLSRPLHVHGAVLTAWFVLLFAQAMLVRSRKVGLHRRLGAAGAVVALGVVGASSWILALRDAPYVEEAPGRGFGNLMSLVAFALCVGVGLFLRRRPPAHRRLMLLGSIVIMAPALSQIFYQPAGASGPATAIAALTLLMTVVAHDALRAWETPQGDPLGPRADLPGGAGDHLGLDRERPLARLHPSRVPMTTAEPPTRDRKDGS